MLVAAVELSSKIQLTLLFNKLSLSKISTVVGNSLLFQIFPFSVLIIFVKIKILLSLISLISLNDNSFFE
ncbi:hypothetical protein [Mycoplasmopsis maculosa]|uniref:hypothetical protein n=1 Tax=Mycoplasmopsis maculosa TaxID=114885 RepID=UPI00101B76F4|nr:hypothetical protein [Mycoplasmopsis maculosa]